MDSLMWFTSGMKTTVSAWEIPIMVILRFIPQLMVETSGQGKYSSTSIPANTSEEYGIVGYFDVIGNTVWFSTTKGSNFQIG